jgi:hypothetical protein
MAERVDHQHGASGTKPPQDQDFQDGEYPNPEEFDWFWNQVPNAINSHADALEDIDSDGDGKVDAADTADSATTANKVKGNDIDSDGDGVVDEADSADQARRVEVRNNDPSSPSDGRMWIRSDL